MEISYTKNGDYYIPNLIVSVKKRPIGKYGNLHKKYLKEHHSGIYTGMLLAGELWKYLADVEEQAQQRMEIIVQQMKVAGGVTEELKDKDQMAWVRGMNSIHNRAEEIVLHELVYEL